MLCKLKGWMDKGGHDDMEMKGWMEKGLHYDKCKLKGWKREGIERADDK